MLVITVVHHPYDSRIWFREIDALLASGWHVTYVAPFSGYNQYPPVRDARLPGSLTCLDIPRAEGRRRSRADRAARELLKRLARHHDLVLVHDPELLVAAAGLRLRTLVWDVHEDPAAALQVKEWMPKTLRPAVAALWRSAERQAERSYQLLLAEFAYQKRFRHHVAAGPNSFSATARFGRRLSWYVIRPFWRMRPTSFPRLRPSMLWLSRMPGQPISTATGITGLRWLIRSLANGLALPRSGHRLGRCTRDDRFGGSRRTARGRLGQRHRCRRLALDRPGWQSDRPVIGRHSRPSWQKWPNDSQVIKALYPVDGSAIVKILGGARPVRDSWVMCRTLGR